VRVDAVLRRAAWSDLWTLSGKPDAHTFEDLCNSADDELFIRIRTSSNHILHALLPPPSTASQNYGLRQRVHSLQLPEHSTHLSDCNVLMCILGLAIVSSLFYLTVFFSVLCVRHSHCF